MAMASSDYAVRSEAGADESAVGLQLLSIRTSSSPARNLRGPEFQIFNSSTAISRANFVNDAVYGKIGQSMTPDLSYYLTVASNPDQLVDTLSTVMMHGQMSPADA